MKTTQTFFILSSGRSGSHFIARQLAHVRGLEMHHEYLCTHVQPLAFKYHLGMIPFDEACVKLQAWYGSAVQYCGLPFWADSSNKLSWLVHVLDAVFPDCRFVHLIRDGRKVVSSYYHKLAHECYDDVSVEVMGRFLRRRDQYVEPPPEKKYWWPMPRPDEPAWSEFQQYNQFQRICYHWREVNETIERDLTTLDSNRVMQVKLEALAQSPERMQSLLDFLQLPATRFAPDQLKRPDNVVRPQDYPLTDEQTMQFNDIAGALMTHYAYDQDDEYRVEYS